MTIVASAVLLGLVVLVGSASAQTPKVGDTFKDCPQCPKMVVVPAGSFRMGSPDREPNRAANEGPIRPVSFARSFAIGKFELTVEEFEAFVTESGYVSIGCGLDGDRSWRSPGFAQTGRNPVVCVSWPGATAYVQWLSRKTRKPYRLPSEAEFEYAARAGTSTARYWGEDEGGCRQMNVLDRRGKTDFPGFPWRSLDCDDGFGATAPVGSYPANRFGLHDTLGNVIEWM